MRASDAPGRDSDRAITGGVLLYWLTSLPPTTETATPTRRMESSSSISRRLPSRRWSSPQVATALDVREQPSVPVVQQLAGRLHDAELLLVLDNFEFASFSPEPVRRARDSWTGCPRSSPPAASVASSTGSHWHSSWPPRARKALSLGGA